MYIVAYCNKGGECDVLSFDEFDEAIKEYTEDCANYEYATLADDKTGKVLAQFVCDGEGRMKIS